MSNNQDWYDDVDEELEDEFEDFSDKPVRRSSGDDVLKKLRRAERSKSKRISELETELLSLRKTQRDSTVKSVLESKGVSPKVAAFIPQDMDITSESLDSWLDDYSDIFGLSKQSEGMDTNNISSDDLAALRQIDIVTGNAAAPDMNDDVYLRLNQAQSAEDIINMINGI